MHKSLNILRHCIQLSFIYITFFFSTITMFSIGSIKNKLNLWIGARDMVKCLKDARGLLRELDTKLEEIQELANTIDASRDDGKLTTEELKQIGNKLSAIADPETIKRVKGVIEWATLRIQQSSM